MSKRYYVCDVIGDGSEFNPYRSKIADLGVKVSAHIPTDETNKPIFTWAIALVETVNHARVAAASGVDSLPDISLDIKPSAISTAARSQVTDMLARRGIEGVAVSSADSYKDVLNGIGRKLGPAFDVDNFGIE